MGSLGVVVGQPEFEGLGALVVTDVGAPVDPLDGEGPVAALGSPVLPRASRLDEFLGGGVPGADCAQRPLVGPGIVGHQPLRAIDAVLGEVDQAAVPRWRRRCRPFRRGQDFRVDQPGVVVDDGVDVVIFVADAGLLR